MAMLVSFSLESLFYGQSPQGLYYMHADFWTVSYQFDIIRCLLHVLSGVFNDSIMVSVQM